MLHKILVIVTAVFAIWVAFYYGKNLYNFTQLIGTKDRESFINNITKKNKDDLENRKSVFVKGHEIVVELAATDAEKTKGLMYREELGQDEGMLFIYNREAPRSFWMKNTLIPLDMIFLDKNKKVVSIQKGAQPCKTATCPIYPSAAPAQYIIEVYAGTASKLSVEVGDIFVWED